ncbi:MAG: hypothetical protein ACYC3I_00515 [Gemmataceae bacterium]
MCPNFAAADQKANLFVGIPGTTDFPCSRQRGGHEQYTQTAAIALQQSPTTTTAAIDTGYTEWLTLPPNLVASLGLRWKTYARGIFAEGSECLFDVYAGKVVWDGKERSIQIDEADSEPLVGMALLSGYDLKMQVRPRGKITIKRLPKSQQGRNRRR